MAFLTQNFDFVEEKRLSGQMIDELIRYMESHLYIIRIKMMYEWVRKNGDIYFISCSSDLYENLGEKIAMSRIPFIIIRDPRGNVGFLVRGSDRETCEKRRAELLEEISEPCKIMSTKELIEFTSDLEDSDKGIVSVTGLSASQLEILEDRIINNIHPKAVGEDLMQDMTYRFSMLGKDAFKKEHNSLAKILLDIQFMTQGPNRTKNNNKAENRRMLEGSISDCLKGKRPVSFIVEGKKYMKLSPEGFEYGFIEKMNGSVRFHREMDGKRDLPDYEDQLYSKLTSFSDAIITTNINEVYNIVDKNSLLVLNESERDRDTSERAVSRMVTDTVRRKMEDDPIMAHEGRYASKMTEMIKEMTKVMKGVLTSTVPLGYTEAEITDISGAMYRYGMKKDEYRSIPEELSKIEIVPVAEMIELINKKKLEKEQRRIRDFERDIDEMER